MSATPAPGIPAFVPDEITGVYEGEELARQRARRETHERLAILERKSDEDRGALHRVEIAVERLCATVQAYVETTREQHKTERVRIGSRAKVIVGIATAIGVIAGAIATALAGGCS